VFEVVSLDYFSGFLCFEEDPVDGLLHVSIRCGVEA
jgi:hypothetical protein